MLIVPLHGSDERAQGFFSSGELSPLENESCAAIVRCSFSTELQMF
jgi:hypothetical protein